MRPVRLLLLLFFVSLNYSQFAIAQDTSNYSKKKATSKVKKAADDLKESLTGTDEEQTARQYETLSKELADKGEYAKAEVYMKKALDIYSRLNKKKEVASVSRSLAKVQESQQKIVPAIQNYRNAAESSKDKMLEQANANDARRLEAPGGSPSKANYIQQNAVLFEQKGEKEEAADAYKQLAETQLKEQNPQEAVASYKKAIAVAARPEEELKITKEIANVYAADQQLDKAIALNEDILQKAREAKDVPRQIDQMIDLAELQARNNQPVNEEALLKEAYSLAIKSRNTLKAKASLTALVRYYKKHNDTGAGMAAYEVFVTNLDSLIRTDGSLVDSRLFEVTESRIRELEQEKALQVELIERKNRFNYVLIGSVLAMLLLLGFIIKSLYAIKIKNKKIALQSLRREMNPHFIFNSLNSVNQYIAENNELQANKYLTSYSGLMRNIMENSNRDFVPLGVEIEQLKKYLELEHLRFHDKFDYDIQIDELLDTDAVLIPNMLIQPHLENAIWHGLRYKEDKGLLQLTFVKKGRELLISVKDNGIGLTRSKALKTANQKAHESRGLTNTNERIGLLNDLYKTKITLTMEEMKGDKGQGTWVWIQLPLIDKK